MNRRDFLKISGLLSAALFIQFNSLLKFNEKPAC